MVDKTKEKKKPKKKEVKQPKKEEVKQTKKEDVKQTKKKEYIYNPDTKRNVKKNGDVGKKVLEKYGGGATTLSLSCCRVTTGTPTQGKQKSAQQAVQPAPAANTARLRTSLKCCPTRTSRQHSTQNSKNTSLPTQYLSNCFNTNIPNTINSQNGIHSCFQLNTFLEEKVINEIIQLTNTLNEWNQSNSLILYDKYTISKKTDNAKNANTQTFEITITPPPKDPPKSPTNSPSGDCDINIKYDNKTVTITEITTEKCGIKTNFLENFRELIKQILEEILTEFVNIFEKMTKVDVNGLVKGVFIAIIVDTIFEDLCKDGKSNKPKICNYPEIKILMNVAANNLTASPIQIITKTTIGIVKSKSELTTLQDMIRKFYVEKHSEQLKQLKDMFNLQ